MVITKKNKLLHFIAFLLPAFVLYTFFFVIPFFQGIKYSFTDWNGIIPEIPFSLNKSDFEENVLKKLVHEDDRRFINEYYLLDEWGENYTLTNWVKEGEEMRQLNRIERKKIKKILNSVGKRSISFIGFENYRQMFGNDERFVPRWEKQFLFNEFYDLPMAITANEFHKQLLNHISNKEDRFLLLTNYHLEKTENIYLLNQQISDSTIQQLKQILSQNWYTTNFIPGVIGFTLLFTIFNVIFSNLIALLLALILDTNLKTKNILRSIFFFPNVLSMVIVAFIWSFVFRLIIPQITGISVWLGSPKLAPYALLAVTVWQGCGWLMIIYLAGLQTIPQDIIEVAEIDGTVWWQRFLHITIPLLLPAFTICTFFSLANSLKTFDVIMALTQGGPGYVTTPIVLDIYYNAFQNNQYGYATAKAVFLCLIIMIITGAQLYSMKRRELEL